MKILITTLVLSLGLNMSNMIESYFHFSLEDRINALYAAEPAGGNDCACDDKERYSGEQKNGGGQEISLAAARGYIQNYQVFYKSPYRGAYISKKAIDAIFCENPRANGLFCYFGLKDGKAENITMIIESGTTETTNISRIPSNPTSIFMGEVICPTICGSSGLNE